MALLHFDGFDLGDQSLVYVGTSLSTSTTTRFSTGRSLLLAGAFTATVSFTPSATLYAGFAYSNQTSSNSTAVFQIYGDSATTEHLRLWWSNASTLSLGRAATSIATAVVPDTAGAWSYIEVMATIADSGGRCVVKVDGTTVIDFTGDTKNAGTSTNIDAVRLGGAAGGQRLFDDFYICDGTGSAPYNTNLGPVRVYTLSPTGAGTDTAMTPSAGANYQCVDEQPYSATDYVTGSTGQRDTYAMADLPAAPGTIFAVQSTAVAAKTDAGALSLKTAIRSGGTVYTGTATALAASDTAVRTIRTTNPATSAAWTKAGVDALEAGAEVA